MASACLRARLLRANLSRTSPASRSAGSRSAPTWRSAGSSWPTAPAEGRARCLLSVKASYHLCAAVPTALAALPEVRS